MVFSIACRGLGSPFRVAIDVMMFLVCGPDTRITATPHFPLPCEKGRKQYLW